MRRSRRIARATAVVGLALLLVIGGWLAWRVSVVGTAYVAKTVCSRMFVSKRELRSVLDEEIRSTDPGILRFVSVEVDGTARMVRGRLLGLGERVAVFRDGLGCTLAIDRSPERLTPRSLPAPAGELRRGAWPSVEWDEGGVVQPVPRLAAVLEEAFSEPVPARPRRTRAAVVVHDGRIIAERYAPGYGPSSALPGWSMTKSAVNALVGILVREGKLALDEPLAVPERGAADDPRRGITLRHLLRMESGLEFSESYSNPLGDVIWMLLGTGDSAGFAARKPLVARPGSRWSYASGTTNIIARALRRAVGGGEMDYLAFPRRALFGPLGMRSALIEPDAAGTFVGSSLMYASGRDWARLGLLYLRDGVVDGVRILPEGWVAFGTTPAPSAVGESYGAHFWRRLPASYAPAGSDGLPPDAFHAVGHEAQIISVVPSRRLVVVRLGLSVGRGVWDHAGFLQRVVAAVDR